MKEFGLYVIPQMQGASFSYVVRADRKQIVTSRKSLKKGKKICRTYALHLNKLR